MPVAAEVRRCRVADAIVLETGETVDALAARIDDVAHGDGITGRVLSDFRRFDRKCGLSGGCIGLPLAGALGLLRQHRLSFRRG